MVYDDKFYVGSWPLNGFPEDAANIIDLTAEFPSMSKILKGRHYICLPCLDRLMPSPEQVISVTGLSIS